MRTTITIEDDVARVIQRLREQRDMTLKAVVNQALRAGLATLTDPTPSKRRAYRTKPVRLGARLPNLDNTAEVLAVAEGEAYR
jgi:hypothetical protein